MSNKTIAVIGDKDCVTAFKAVGADVYHATTKEQTEALIKELVKKEYAIILITEDKAESVMEFILQFKSNPYPIILTIPPVGGTTGLGMNGLKYNMEKAIGMDILFQQRG